MEISKYIRENIKRLAPYSTARDEAKYDVPISAYLDANENPNNTKYNRYPDPYQKKLKSYISEIKGTPVENIFLGNGSDEAIDLVFRIFCTPRKDKIITIKPSYGMYKVCADINDVECIEVALDEDFTLNANNILKKASEDVKVIFLCSPNNPSGNLLERAEVEKIIIGFDGIVVLDEAYIDFAEEYGFLPELDKYPNLIILQTLSKAWGMAGLRLGMAFASIEIINYFGKVKYPYNIGEDTQKEVIAQLRKYSSKKEEEIKEIIEDRKALALTLEEIDYIKKVYPSDANFILIKVDDATSLYNYLALYGGVLVRNRTSIYGCEGCLRITVGTDSENERLLYLLYSYKAK